MRFKPTKPELETRIILTTVLLLVLAVALVALFSYRMLKSDLEGLQAKQQFSAATLMANRIDRTLQDQTAALSALAQMLHKDEKLKPIAQIQTLLDNRILLHAMFNTGLIVMNDKGVAVADSPGGRAGIDFSDRTHIRYVLQTGQPTVSPPVPAKTFSGAVMSISVPVKTPSGRVIGLVQGVINLSKPNFLDEVGQLSYGQSGGYLISDRKSKLVVAATDKRRIMQPTPALGTNPVNDRFMAGYEGSGIAVTPLGQEVLASAKTIPSVDWFAVAMLPTDEAFSPVRRMTQNILLAAIALVVLSGTAAWWLLRRQLARIRQERDFYSAQMRQSSDGIFIFDPSSRLILEANTQMSKLLGYQPDELTGLKLGDVVQVPEAQIARQIDAIRNQKRIQVGERLFRCKDGASLEVEVSASSVVSGEHEVLMVNVRDITERKRDERALKQSEERYKALSSTLADRVEKEVQARLEKERLLAAQQAVLIQQTKLAELGSMIGAIAHQWKQPLNAIAMLTQELPDALEDGELNAEFVDRHVGKVMGQIRFMSQTVEDFRNFYKPSARKEPFNLKAAIASVADLLRNQLMKSAVTLELDINESIEVEGFASEFKQVILNLINNAKDAIETRRVAKGRIRIFAELIADRVCLFVCDNAGGIPADLLPEKLFEPFATTKGEAGTGIGLSLSKTIIEEKMNGTIAARNLEDGAEFTLEIPLARKGRL